jgi:hypothetical protein
VDDVVQAVDLLKEGRRPLPAVEGVEEVALPFVLLLRDCGRRERGGRNEQRTEGHGGGRRV